MGSDREEGEDEAEVVKEGDRVRRQAEELYEAQVVFLTNSVLSNHTIL